MQTQKRRGGGGIRQKAFIIEGAFTRSFTVCVTVAVFKSS